MSTEVALFASTDAVAMRALVEELEQVKARIPTLDADELEETRLRAKVLSHAASAAKADEVASAAAELRVRCERRLGKLLEKSGKKLTLTNKDRVLIDLWRIPEDLFEDTIKEMLYQRRFCEPSFVLLHAMRKSLRRVEAGIEISWDGRYWLTGKTKRAGQFFPTLEGARMARQRDVGLRKAWTETKKAQQLDDAHARSRRLAQALSLLGESFKGKPLDLIQEAELLQSKVAELLYLAWKESEAIEDEPFRKAEAARLKDAFAV